MKTEIVSKRILVTGGAGFIGSHLCKHFLSGNFVRSIDNLSTGFLANVEPLQSNSDFEFIQGDIRDFDFALRVTENIDIVFHQAALGSVPRSIENPVQTNSNNIDGFLNILEASRLNKVKRFVYATSSSVYGDSPELPKIEERIGKPLSPYAVTKRVNEIYAKVYSDLYQIETIGLRYFNVFGEGQSPIGAYAAVIPRFISAILNNGDLTIYGNGEQTRDFTFIDNVIYANELAATISDSAALNEVYNIGCSDRLSILDVATFLIEYCHTKYGMTPPKIQFLPDRKGDIKDSFASIDKAKKLLKYLPDITVREGLARLVDSHFKK